MSILAQEASNVEEFCATKCVAAAGRQLGGSYELT